MNLKYMDVEMISNAQIPISDSQFASDYLTVMSSNSRVQALSLKSYTMLTLIAKNVKPSSSIGSFPNFEFLPNEPSQK